MRIFVTFLLLTDPASIKPNPAYEYDGLTLIYIIFILKGFTCIKMMRDPLIVRKKLSRLVMMSRVNSSFSARRDKRLVTFKDSSDMFCFQMIILSQNKIKGGTFAKFIFSSVVYL